jgi:predicted secreted protein
MASSALPAHGTTIQIEGDLIGEIKTITLGARTAKTVDITSHDSDYDEFAAGLKNGGEVTITGLYVAGNVGQEHVEDAYEADPQVLHTYVITPPAASATIVTIEAIVTSLAMPASANYDGALDYSMTLKVSGTPVRAVGASAGCSALVVTSNAGAISSFTPTPHDAGTLEYIYNVLTTETWVKFTATFAAGTCVVHNDFDDGDTSLTSTVISGELSLDGADTITHFTVTQKDPNEVAAVYDIMVRRPTA